MRGAADTTLQKDVKETQPLVFQPLTSPFDFLTVENEILKYFQENVKSAKLPFGYPACQISLFFLRIHLFSIFLFLRFSAHGEMTPVIIKDFRASISHANTAATSFLRMQQAA